MNGERIHEGGGTRTRRSRGWVPRLCALVIAAGLVAAEGCGRPYFYYAVRPMRTDGMTGHRMEYNYVTSPPLPGRLSVNAARAQAANGRTLFFIEVNYANGPRIGVPAGESLVFTADGERIALSGRGSVGGYAVGPGQMMPESAIFEISLANLRKIADATHVHLRLTGRDAVLENTFNPLNTARFRDFLAKHVPEAAPADTLPG